MARRGRRRRGWKVINARDHVKEGIGKRKREKGKKIGKKNNEDREQMRQKHDAKERGRVANQNNEDLEDKTRRPDQIRLMQ